MGNPLTPDAERDLKHYETTGSVLNGCNNWTPFYAWILTVRWFHEHNNEYPNE